jgi:glutaredoxin
MSDIVVFSTPGCKNCKALKTILNMIGKRFEVRDMASSDAIAELLSEGVMVMSAPVLKIDDKYFDLQDIFPGGDTNSVGKDVANALMMLGTESKV